MLGAVLGMLPVPSGANDISPYRLVDGMAIYYAVVPAEVVRGLPKGRSEATMHGGVPGGKHVHHVMVALFERGSLERITDARVTASVGEVGLAPIRKPLEPFVVSGALTYGNYFELAPHAAYRIDVEISRPDAQTAVVSRFEFDHR